MLLCSYLCPLNPELSTGCTVFISDIIGSTLHSSMYFLHLLFTLTILWMSIMVVQYYTLGGLHFTLANLFYSLDLQMHLSYLYKSTSSESGLIQHLNMSCVHSMSFKYRQKRDKTMPFLCLSKAVLFHLTVSRINYF